MKDYLCFTISNFIINHSFFTTSPINFVIDTSKDNRPDLSERISDTLGRRFDRNDLGHGKCVFSLGHITAAERELLETTLVGHRLNFEQVD